MALLALLSASLSIFGNTWYIMWLQALLITINDSYGIRSNLGIHCCDDIRGNRGIHRDDDIRSNHGIYRGDDIRSNDDNYVTVACRSNSKLRHGC